jgi:cation diffusion facilitator family transporter
MSRTVRIQNATMLLSLVVAILLLAGKVIGAVLTGSSAIYSDAAESVVHLFAVIFAVWALRLARKPADASHHYGHDKISFISAGFEGAMISAAAFLILYEAVKQLFFGVSINNLNLGLWITSSAAITNLILSLILIRVGKRTASPLISANGIHVLTDVWTSIAVVVGLVLIHYTGWLWWDPIVAAIAAFNILRVGLKLIRQSLGGLLDEADPEIELLIRKHLDAAVAVKSLSYHNFRYRHSGHSHWVEFHLVLPNDINLNEAHHLATEIESGIASLMGFECRVISHIEPRSAENEVKPWEKP